MQFVVHFVEPLTVLLHCDGFARSQEALVESNRGWPPRGRHDLSLVQCRLWEMLRSFVEKEDDQGAPIPSFEGEAPNKTLGCLYAAERLLNEQLTVFTATWEVRFQGYCSPTWPATTLSASLVNGWTSRIGELIQPGVLLTRDQLPSALIVNLHSKTSASDSSYRIFSP